MPPVGRFAWDFLIAGNCVDSSGFDFASPKAAEVAAVRRLYAYFDSLGTLVDKDAELSLYVASEAKDRHGESVYHEGVGAFGLPWFIRDNEGATADRYTVYFHNGSEYLALGEGGDSYGWGEYVRPHGKPDVDDDATWLHVGKNVAWSDLPDDVRAAIRARMDEALDDYARD